MKWRTPITIRPGSFFFSYNDSSFLIGSCFSQNIGTRFQRLGFKTQVNPFGTIYNPVSIFEILKRSVHNDEISKEELFKNQSLYRHYDVHSSLAFPDCHRTAYRINEAMTQTRSTLSYASLMIVTLGTAWVHCLKSSGHIVANCHKMPASHFDRKLLSVDETVESLRLLIDMMRALNHKVKFILTVSPVRHLKDGHIANQRSKATLLLAIHEICKHYDRCDYFPAYEIVMDDLRDYRFFDSDLVHPNSMAVDYIWERFLECHAGEKVRDQIASVDKVLKTLEHRPFHQETGEYKALLTKLDQKMGELEGKIAGLDLSHARQVIAEKRSK